MHKVNLKSLKSLTFEKFDKNGDFHPEVGCYVISYGFMLLL